jgi:DNA-binding MurR/RpiR family transcriptional regulator
VFGVGTSAIAGLDFQTKMVRLGRQCNLNLNSILMDGYALSSTDRSVNIILSQSGETAQIIEISRILKKNGRYIVCITGNTKSTAASLSSEVISIKTDEDNSFQVKIESFASNTAMLFVLDCLYCFMFSLNYDRNVDVSRKKAYAIREAGGKG